MNAKHTPGPWEAVGNLVRSPMVQPQGLSKGVQIAECRDAYFLSHTEESKANARLIAAAPELLEVAQMILAEDLLDFLPEEYASKVRAAGFEYYGVGRRPEAAKE